MGAAYVEVGALFWTFQTASITRESRAMCVGHKVMGPQLCVLVIRYVCWSQDDGSTAMCVGPKVDVCWS